jgi:hypothetical protein
VNKVTASFKGLDVLINNLKLAEEKAPALLSKALYEEALATLVDSQLLVPVDTGALRASGGVKQPEIVGKKIEVTMYYGGPAAPYALFVHEIARYKHAPPTQYKFLEAPALKRVPVLTKNLGIRVADMLRETMK